MSGIPQLAMPHGLAVSVQMGFDVDNEKQNGQSAKFTKNKLWVKLFGGSAIKDAKTESAKYKDQIATWEKMVADGGKNMSEPLVNPLPCGTRYQVGAYIQCPQGEPWVQGFTLKWKVAEGWKWEDGAGDETNIELVCNPMWVKRIATSPETIPAGKRYNFGCQLTKLYGVDANAARAAGQAAASADANVGGTGGL